MKLKETILRYSFEPKSNDIESMFEAFFERLKRNGFDYDHPAYIKRDDGFMGVVKKEGNEYSIDVGNDATLEISYTELSDPHYVKQIEAAFTRIFEVVTFVSGGFKKEME